MLIVNDLVDLRDLHCGFRKDQIVSTGSVGYRPGFPIKFSLTRKTFSNFNFVSCFYCESTNFSFKVPFSFFEDD